MAFSILRLRNILLAPLPEDLTDADALEFQASLLRQLAETECTGVLIDVSALELVDSFLARVVNDTATMVRLLGAQAVLVGMQPAVALTLMEVGRGLIGVSTALDLDQGIDRLQEMIVAADGGERTA